MLDENSVDSDQTAPKEQSDQGLHCFHFICICTMLSSCRNQEKVKLKSYFQSGTK